MFGSAIDYFDHYLVIGESCGRHENVKCGGAVHLYDLDSGEFRAKILGTHAQGQFGKAFDVNSAAGTIAVAANSQENGSEKF